MSYHRLLEKVYRKSEFDPGLCSQFFGVLCARALHLLSKNRNDDVHPRRNNQPFVHEVPCFARRTRETQVRTTAVHKSLYKFQKKNELTSCRPCFVFRAWTTSQATPWS